jgi:hypothetical protein
MTSHLLGARLLLPLVWPGVLSSCLLLALQWSLVKTTKSQRPTKYECRRQTNKGAQDSHGKCRGMAWARMAWVGLGRRVGALQPEPAAAAPTMTTYCTTTRPTSGTPNKATTISYTNHHHQFPPPLHWCTLLPSNHHPPSTPPPTLLPISPRQQTPTLIPTSSLWAPTHHCRLTETTIEKSRLTSTSRPH